MASITEYESQGQLRTLSRASNVRYEEVIPRMG